MGHNFLSVVHSHVIPHYFSPFSLTLPILRFFPPSCLMQQPFFHVYLPNNASIEAKNVKLLPLLVRWSQSWFRLMRLADRTAFRCQSRIMEGISVCRQDLFATPTHTHTQTLFHNHYRFSIRKCKSVVITSQLWTKILLFTSSKCVFCFLFFH